MELNQALSIAKQLKNHWKAFQFLEEFIKEAGALQNLMKESEARKAKLREEISVLLKQKADAEELAEASKKANEEQTADALRELSAHHSEYSAKINKKIELLNLKMDEAETKMEEIEADHAKKMEAMIEEERSAQERLDAITRKIQAIKAKLE